jgi:membrane-bound serine protease (ClpP class)
MGRLIATTTLTFFAVIAAATPAEVVHVLTYEGAITPAASEYIVGGIDRAEVAGAEVLVLRLDTPGGLDSSMREIVKRQLAATVPVVVYVAPSGSRAASAGAFITLAAHVAAMAPGTNIGSASPLQMGGAIADTTMAHKVLNDAAAYIAAIAVQRGRNADLARAFVVSADNVTAEEARSQRVIDLVVPTLPALLDSLEGRTVALATGPRVLRTRGAQMVSYEMSWRQNLLKRLADPNLAYILMLLGIYGLFFELSNPGALVPGILGGICLLLALFAFQTLPVNFAGVGLILLGTILFILEVKVQSYGGLTIGGLVSLVLGSLLLFDAGEPWARISLGVMIPALLVFGGFFVLCLWLVVKGQRRPVATGKQSLVGSRGRVVAAIPGGAQSGKVVCRGEVWDAVADGPLDAGRQIEVVQMNGRVACVRTLEP